MTITRSEMRVVLLCVCAILISSISCSMINILILYYTNNVIPADDGQIDFVILMAIFAIGIFLSPAVVALILAGNIGRTYIVLCIIPTIALTIWIDRVILNFLK